MKSSNVKQKQELLREDGHKMQLTINYTGEHNVHCVEKYAGICVCLPSWAASLSVSEKFYLLLSSWSWESLNSLTLSVLFLIKSSFYCQVCKVVINNWWRLMKNTWSPSCIPQVRTLFVSGLPLDIKPRELYLLFRPFKVCLYVF